MSALTGSGAFARPYDGPETGVIVEVITSRERFMAACPCAEIISSYVSKLLEGQGLTWAFGKAIVRPTHTSAMFICVDPRVDAHELWVSAKWVEPGEWVLQHSPVPVR